MKRLIVSSVVTVLGLGIVTSINAEVAGHAYVKLTEITPTAEQALWSRSKDVPVGYPVELAMDGVTGCAVLKVTIDSDGDTDEVTLMSGVPSREMKFSARKLVRDWDWMNRSERPDAAETKLIRLDFCMERGTKDVAIAACEEQVKLECR